MTASPLRLRRPPLRLVQMSSEDRRQIEALCRVSGTSALERDLLCQYRSQSGLSDGDRRCFEAMCDRHSTVFFFFY